MANAYENIVNKKFLDGAGVGHLWDKIKDAYDSKLDEVVANDASIKVTENNKIEVVISEEAGNLLQLKTTGDKKGLYVQSPASPDTYAIVKEDSDAYAGVYKLKKYVNGAGDGVDAGVAINIPKDMVVQGGNVVTKSEAGAWGQPGTYIELTLANATNDKLYIAVDDLIEYVTSGSTANDKIQIAVSDDHKVTATIKAGSIEKADLADAVQASLDKADSAVQTIVSGDTNGTIKVDGAEVAVKGLGTAAYKADTAFDAAGAAGAVLGTDSDAASEATVYGVKKYASDAYAAIQPLTNAEIDAAIAGA